MHSAAGVLATAGYAFLRALPVKMASDLMAVFIGRVAHHLVRERKIRKNLRTAFPDLDESGVDALTAEIIANFGRVLAEVVHISTYAAGKQGTVVDAAGSLEHTFEQSRQAVYVTAHLGNWELIPIVLRRKSRPTIIYTPLGNPLIDDLLLAQRRKTGADYVEKSEALRACIKAMKKGGSIGLLVDQHVARGVNVSFFGNPTMFTDLPVRLAMKFNCPVIPIEAVCAGPGHCQVMIHQPIWPGEDHGKEAVRDLTQQVANVIEDAIRKRPGEWYCDKRRWKKKDRFDEVPGPRTARTGALESRPA